MSVSGADDRSIRALEQEVAHEMEMIARALERKYTCMQPVLSGERYDIASHMDDLAHKMEDKLQLMEKAVSKTDVVAAAHEEHSLRSRLSELGACSDVVKRFGELERKLNHIYLDDSYCNKRLVNDAKDLSSARALHADIMDDLRESGLAEGAALADRISSLLLAEIDTANKFICWRVNTAMKHMVSYPDSKMKGLFCMQLAIEKSSDVSDVISAMQTVGATNWEEWIARWSDVVLNSLALPLISACDSHTFKWERHPLQKHVCRYMLSSRTKTSDYAGTQAVEETLKVVEEVFTRLCTDLNGCEAGSVSLIRALGEIITKPLMLAVLKMCVSVCCDEERECAAMGMAEAWRERMVTAGLFNDATPSFASLAEQHENVFVDRRCLAVLNTARQLITQQYLDLVQVGSGMEGEVESVEEYAEAYLTPSSHFRAADNAHPTLLRLLQCKVSRSTVEFVGLLDRTLTEAVNSDNEALSGRLALTARNAVKMFILIAPRHHKHILSTVPHMAAVYYNNCYYICHRILLMPFDVIAQSKNAKKNDGVMDHVRPLLVSEVWSLRESAAKVLESVLAQSRRQIAATLAETHMFVGARCGEECETADVVHKCVSQCASLHSVWKDVLSETVLCSALGNVVSFLLSELCRILLSFEDFHSADADAAAVLIGAMLKQLDVLFVVRGSSTLHKMCERPFFRIKEVAQCLSGSLQSVCDRWCDGKGPLAEWVRASEVRGLVKALFANTEQRKRLLDSIF